MESDTNSATQPTMDRDGESQEGLQVAEDPEKRNKEKKYSYAEEVQQLVVGRGKKKMKNPSC